MIYTRHLGRILVTRVRSQCKRKMLYNLVVVVHPLLSLSLRLVSVVIFARPLGYLNIMMMMAPKGASQGLYQGR